MGDGDNIHVAGLRNTAGTPGLKDFVSSMLARRLDHLLVREALRRPRDLFSGEQFQSQVTIHVNEMVVNSEDTLTTWLNAFEYHRDADKQAVLRTIAPVIPLEAARAIFVSMMLDKAKAIFELGRLVHDVDTRRNRNFRYHDVSAVLFPTAGSGTICRSVDGASRGWPNV